MVEMVMRKRTARAGEVGLFIDSPVWEGELANIKEGAEVKVVATTPRSLRQLKFAWALATKVAEACDWLETKEDAMDTILIEARHFKRIYDPIRQIAHLRPKPTNFGSMDGSDYTRLLNRMKHAIMTVILPQADMPSLVAEIEAMIGPDLEPVEKTKPSRRREPAARAPQPQRKEAEATGAEEKEPVRSGDAKATAEEYIAKARAWIAQQTDHAAALALYDSETHVAWRKRCQLSEGQERMIRRELAQHFEGKTNAA